jgi:tRNA(Ile)-lysidine synthase
MAEALARCRFPAKGEPLTCAVSGGADSLALLVLAYAHGCDVTAVHVDHGLRDGSAAEADVVAQVANALGARFVSKRVEVAAGPNLEARARRARYSVLPPDVATGHTADDQAETVLLNLLRGSGINGLAGMRPGPRHPILALRRSETAALCARVGLTPVQDPSNDDLSFARNRVRHELVPLCASIARRDIVSVIAKQATILAAEADLLDSEASQMDPTDAAALCRAPYALARRSVRMWLKMALPDGYPPSSAAVERVLRVARGEVRAAEVAARVRVRRSRRRLFVEDAPELAASGVTAQAGADTSSTGAETASADTETASADAETASADTETAGTGSVGGVDFEVAAG